MQNISYILSSLGYSLRDTGTYWRTRPLYRESDNPTVLGIHKQTGKWFDFSANKGGSLKELVEITCQYQGLDIKVDDLLKIFDSSLVLNLKHKIRTIKYYDNEILNKLVKDHSYWVNRGIPLHIISQFNGGIAKTGSLKDRYVFPVYDEYNRITGFAGRDLKNISNEDRKKYGRPKWKLMLSSSDTIYPLSECENNDRAFLVESIGDMLSLITAGYQNVFVLFGVKIFSKLINFLVKKDFKKIVIAMNNDSENNSVGNEAANSIKLTLSKFFDENQLEIILPVQNDWNVTNLNDIKRLLQ